MANRKTNYQDKRHSCPPKNLPGLYIHIPFCRSKCLYCSFYSTTSVDRIDAFLDALFGEMRLYGLSWNEFDTLYIGGGSPSVLSIEHFSRILEQVHKTFRICKDAEITIEINPADMAFRDMQSLRRCGVNRLSIGVQSFDDDILTFLGRRHTASQAIHAIRDARQAGFENIGIDLIYGIPDQALYTWEDTLSKAISFDTEHLSCYQLTVGSDTPLADKHRRGEFLLPNDDAQYEFFMTTAAMLEQEGYVHYEVSNFARNLDSVSKHNSKYWNHTPYLGLGPSAHSFAANKRWWNQHSLKKYLQDVNSGKIPIASSEALSADDLRLEALFLGMRTKEGINLRHFNARFNCDLLDEKARIIETLQNSGVIKIEGGYLRPTAAGLAVADSLSLI